MKKMKIFVILFLLLGFTALFFYAKMVVFDEKDSVNLSDFSLQGEINTVEGDVVSIFVPDSDMKALIVKKINIEKKELDRERINLIFKALRDDPDSVIPKKTEIKNIFRDNSTLYLNLSDAVLGFNNDSSTEMMLVYSIVNTFCSYENINKVKILINNKEVDTLGGYVNLRDYFERDTLLVKGE